MDDLRFFEDRELSATEVTDLYNQTIKDESGNGNDGTLTNGAYVGESDEIVVDGTDDYALVSASTDFEITSGISLSAWVKSTTSDSSYRSILDRRETAGDGWILQTEPNGYARSIFYSVGSFRELIGTTNIRDGVWHHVAATYDTTNGGILYVDGVQEKTGASVGAINYAVARDLTIGNQQGQTQYWDGSIRDPRVFNRTLTAAEVAFLASEYEVETPNTKGSVLSIVPSYDDWGNATLNAIDFSGNGNVGTLTNMTTGDWVADTDSGGTRALDFDGTNDYVDVGNVPELDITADLTVSTWVVFDSFSTTPHILGKYDVGAPQNGYVLWANSSGVVTMSVTLAGTQTTASSGVLSTGTLYNITSTYDGANVKLYVDGVLVATTARTGLIGIDADPFVIGVRSDLSGSYHHDGYIDDSYVWDRALSLDEIKALASTRNYFGTPAATLRRNGTIMWMGLTH
jgi:hypothetical protein